MKRTEYLLSVKSGGWSHHPTAHDPDYRLLSFQLIANRAGKPLGGNNVQAVVGAPDQTRTALDEDIAMWLASGWWVTFRNQFADAPGVATEIVASAEDQLTELTAELHGARGARTEALTAELFDAVFPAEGPDYWR